MLKIECSVQRQEKLLRHCTIIAEEVGGLADSLTDKDAAEEILAWINRNYDNPETNKDYRIAFRVLAKQVTGGSEAPESVDWVPSSPPRSYNPKSNPAEMLNWKDTWRPALSGEPHSSWEGKSIQPVVDVSDDFGPTKGPLETWAKLSRNMVWMDIPASS